MKKKRKKIQSVKI